ncbi:hypothetical protein OS493_001988 [Desmophyllum pertusum]|uniref:G-protein coupled receptors family 1 profile domain-containing protein n=1 Tax=Desmophyllum pertusum TaxID=174260 RepID=A0A9W9Z4R7_9CNID|nr:hypothetical protein OS493_001988 [Desmophyllum pertusum]
MENNTKSWNLTDIKNSTRPGTSGGPHEMTTGNIVEVVFFCILAVMIVFTNSLMIGAFRVNRRLRTRNNLLLMSLAVADMLVGSISVPLYLLMDISPRHFETFFSRGVFTMFDVICGVSSILNLTAISLERCYALLCPIKHRNIRKRVVLAIILVTWILAVLAGTKISFFAGHNYADLIVIVAIFFVPLAIILGAYGTIFHIARAHARGRGISSFKKDLRIAMTVAVVIGLFVICWTPFLAICFTVSVCSVTTGMSAGCQGFLNLPQVLVRIFKWLQYGNSVCNPIVYGLRNEEFRRAFRKLLLGLCCKEVRITEYDKNAHGRVRQVPGAHLQYETRFENLQQLSVTPSPQPPSGLFHMRRESYCEGIQIENNNPIKLDILTTKSLADGFQALNEDHAIHTLPSDVTSVSNLLTSTSAVASCSAEHCNPAFEHDQTETGIYAIYKAIPPKTGSNNMTGSKIILQKRSTKEPVQNIETSVSCSLHRFKQPRKMRTIETRF